MSPLEKIMASMLLSLAVVLPYVIYKQHQTINALIELNHDKSVYIDSGCREPYKGTEEMLPAEAAGTCLKSPFCTTILKLDKAKP